ncbi:hypothetical protein T484DRAFT_1949997 [Baffinella frigidus]|nr:hypothetical protein T484DRAFT_1949997 [Cryptophyta sp. CCMP2293]
MWTPPPLRVLFASRPPRPAGCCLRTEPRHEGSVCTQGWYQVQTSPSRRCVRESGARCDHSRDAHRGCLPG